MTHGTVARQAPLSMGSSRQRILEWVAIAFSRGLNTCSSYCFLGPNHGALGAESPKGDRETGTQESKMT